jgi:putative transcriptional regulator
MYLGGPVGMDRLNFLHAYGELIPNSLHVIDNLYWNGDYDALKEGIGNRTILPHNVKFFIGYSGWGPDQIDDEMEENSWIVSRGYRPIFRNPDLMWQDTLSKMGGKYKLMSNYPEDPSLN